MTTVLLRDGKSGKWLQLTADEQRIARELESRMGRERAAKRLGTSPVTFERLVSGAWCMKGVVERVRRVLPTEL